ncbi:MAG: flagellar export protein FliJ [Oscillospiraceae bacterium]|nr:flagellar FliJ family protein [Oscillospiraceae bacterium]
MKAFRFSLDRVREFKSQILDKEKKTLGVLLKNRDDILLKIAEIEQRRLALSREAENKQIEGISAIELNSYNYLLENARTQLEMLNIQLNKAEEELEAQRQVVLAIYQEKTGMDKLEERQLEEYRLLEAKENENDIMQVISNKMA